jgi:hypothetical protein
MLLEISGNQRVTAGPQLAALRRKVLLNQRAECVRRSRDPNPLLRRRVVAEVDLGVELGRNLAGARPALMAGHCPMTIRRGLAAKPILK